MDIEKVRALHKKAEKALVETINRLSALNRQNERELDIDFYEEEKKWLADGLDTLQSKN